MTNDILQSINQKNRLYKILMHTDTDNSDLFNRQKDEYKQYRTYLRKQFREAKRKYYDHIFSLYKKYIKKNMEIFERNLKGECSVFKKNYNMDENDSLSEYNKIPLGHNRTNGAVYSKIYFEVEICSAC